jgi:peptidyl-prolyl cis-trans isomerase SurA
MNRLQATRFATSRAAMRCACIAAVLVVLRSAAAQVEKTPKPGAAVTLDRVVAVVNRQAILESDIEEEMQLSVLDPGRITQEKMTERQALEQLISRALIQQQIRQEDLPATEPKPEMIASRIREIRTELPVCVRANCKTDAGWQAFLAQHELTQQEFEDYLRHRLEILSFIEMRFRQGIRISPEEVKTYYEGTLLPEYPAGETPPPLQQVSSRIEEILLQQRVNQLFDDWLANLRKQGQVEVLDPTLETAATTNNQGASKE